MNRFPIRTATLAILLGTGVVLPGAAHEEETPPPVTEPRAESHAHCVDGLAADLYPCEGIDLLSLSPRSAIGAGAGIALNDVWGWTDADTGREYALVGLADGTSFVDVTDPLLPVYLGKLPTRTVASSWRDIKVYADQAYVVADGAGSHGLQVFDLTRLRQVSNPPRTFDADAEYFGPLGEPLGSAHNLAIDEASGFAYVVGADSCDEGIHIVDLADPADPEFAGCYGEAGYVHDVQCVVYAGPDEAWSGRQICVASAVSALVVVDVTDPSDPVTVGVGHYPSTEYAHQGWLTEDHRYFLLGDELDELRRGNRTRTLIFDLEDLEQPVLAAEHLADTVSIDHNMYVRDGLLYQANYRAGLRVFSLDRVKRGKLDELAFFDVYPTDDALEFSGAWSVYPFFASGTLAVSGIEQGLFLLELSDHATLEAPDRVKVKIRRQGTRAVVTWKDRSDGESGFRVYRSVDGLGLEPVAEVGKNKKKLKDDDLPTGWTTLAYQVVAFSELGEGEPSEAVAASR